MKIEPFHTRDIGNIPLLLASAIPDDWKIIALGIHGRDELWYAERGDGAVCQDRGLILLIDQIHYCDSTYPRKRK